MRPIQNIILLVLLLALATQSATAQSPNNLKTLDMATLQQQAEAGDAAAQNELGHRILGSGNPTKTSERAIVWFRKAAEQGNADAESSLAFCYRSGRGVAKDESQALFWYKKAAEQGNSTAQLQIGLSYEYGWGVTQNYALAMSWLRKAAANGAVYAQYEIGLMYRDGLGVPKSRSQARLWFQKAADQGNQFAKDALAQMNAPPVRAVAPTQTTQAPSSQPPYAAQHNKAQRGTCAAVYIINVGGEYGQHYDYGAAWSRSSYDDALAGAKSQLMQVAVGVDPADLPGGKFGPPPATGSGCTYAHGAVAGKLKIRPSGGSMWNPGGAAGTSILGAGIYDMVTVNFADSTDAAVSVAISQCQVQKGSGDNDHEVCKVLEQW